MAFVKDYNNVIDMLRYAIDSTLVSHIIIMRSSRQVSVLTAPQKLNYPKCNRKKEHAKEVMNFICLSNNCSRKGLICALCKSSSQHAGHNVQPLKTFLAKMQETLKKNEFNKSELPIQERQPSKPKNQTNLLQRLQQSHLQLLSVLKIHVEEISERVMRCQEELMQQYSKARLKLICEFEKETLIGKTLAEIQGGLCEQDKQQNDLKNNVLKLLSMVKVQKLVQNEAEAQFNSYQLAASAFKMNLLAWERQTINIIGDIFRLKPEYEIKEQKIRPTTAGPSKTSSNPFSFSSTLKTQSILLTNDNKVIKVKDDKNGKVVLLSQKVDEHKGPFKLKIASLGSVSQIQLGVCIKSQVVQKQYKFQKTNQANFNHGYCVFSSNGFIYSTNDTTANYSKSNFLFKLNDQLTMEVDDKAKKLLLKKKTQSKSHQINLQHISNEDWQDLYFCVSLSQVGDKVQLLS